MHQFHNWGRPSPTFNYARLGVSRRVLRRFKYTLTSVFIILTVSCYMGYLPALLNFPGQIARSSAFFQHPSDAAQLRGGARFDSVSSTEEYEGMAIQKSDDQLRKTNVALASSGSAGFAKSLTHIVQLLPSEKEGRALLQPIEGTGVEKLREIGVRARAYKKYLDAWEDLHFVEYQENVTIIRPDVIQQIRRWWSQGPGGVSGKGLEQMIHMYESYKGFICVFGQLMAGWTTPYFSDHMSLHLSFKNAGRGIVLTAGSWHAPHLKTLISSLRDVGCTLPVEVMFLDDADLDAATQTELEALDGVLTREIWPMVDDRGWKLGGWALKPFAILLSSFREVIFIDADSLFFHNPEGLFDDADYARTGALFFKDRSIYPESKKNWLKSLLPGPVSAQVKNSRLWTGESGHMQESGVIVVDKFRHFMALLVVCRMNGPERNGNEDKSKVGVYDMVYGDKETFWLGWELAGDVDYSFHDGAVAAMGQIEKSAPKSDTKSDTQAEPSKGGDTTICSPQLLHLDANGKPLWFNGGLFENKFADRSAWVFGKFDYYIVERPRASFSDDWTMESNNKVCLTEKSHWKHPLSDDEKATLDTMIGHAKRYL